MKDTDTSNSGTATEEASAPPVLTLEKEPSVSPDYGAATSPIEPVAVVDQILKTALIASAVGAGVRSKGHSVDEVRIRSHL